MLYSVNPVEHTQEPLESCLFDVAEHERHSLGRGPLQVVQVMSHKVETLTSQSATPTSK